MSQRNILENISQNSENGNVSMNISNKTTVNIVCPENKDESYVRSLEKFENSKEEIFPSDFENIFKLAHIKPDKLLRCNRVLKNNISVKIFLSFLNLAEENKNDQLSSFCEQFISEYFEQIVKEDDFLKLREKNLKNILSSNNLKISSEKRAFESLKKWYNNENNKRKDFCQLLQYIRFTNLSIKYFSATVVSELNKKCDVCAKKNDSIKDWYIFPDLRPNYQFNTDPRRYYEETFLQISTNDNLEYKNIIKYDPNNKLWSELRTFNSNIRYSCVKILDGKLIFLGGHVLPSNDVTNMSLCMDFRHSFEEIKIKPMQQTRIFFDAVVKDKKILVFGGIDNDRKETNSVEIWDSITNEWKQIEGMKHPRYHPTAVLYKGEAYVFGGYNEKEYLKSFEVYNFNNKKWELYKMDSESNIKCFDFCHIKSTTLDDYIYVYECFKESSTYEHHLKRFNPSKSKTEWFYLAEIPSPQECRYLISHELKITFFGSENNYVYNPEENKWSEFSSQELIDNYNHIFSVPKTHLEM